METRTKVLVGDLMFPESPRWHEGRLWFSDLSTGQVMNVDLDGDVQTVVEVPATPSGLGWTPAGQLLIVSANDRRLLRLEDDGLAVVADLSGLVSYPNNDMVVDGQGRAYIGNMGFDFGAAEAAPQPGPLLLVTAEGSARVVAEGLAFPNGLVITPDGHTLIIAESHAARLTAFDIAADGSLSHRRVWAQFDDRGDFGAAEGQITPDGICLDAEGAVWVASPNTAEVLRVREGAEITHRIPLERVPLACMLGGPERRTLFIPTTASLDPSDDSAGGRIETIEVAVAGAGLP
ncbi:MAG: SMP-30/gluconolactonase/LRE family protein [Chloroflexota bacterium]